MNTNVLAVGMDALADPAAKSSSRSPFDSNVVCDFERMVKINAHLFKHFITIRIGIDSGLYLSCLGHQYLKHTTSNRDDRDSVQSTVQSKL